MKAFVTQNFAFVTRSLAWDYLCAYQSHAVNFLEHEKLIKKEDVEGKVYRSLTTLEKDNPYLIVDRLCSTRWDAEPHLREKIDLPFEIKFTVPYLKDAFGQHKLNLMEGYQLLKNDVKKCDDHLEIVMFDGFDKRTYSLTEEQLGAIKKLSTDKFYGLEKLTNEIERQMKIYDRHDADIIRENKRFKKVQHDFISGVEEEYQYLMVKSEEIEEEKV